MSGRAIVTGTGISYGGGRARAGLLEPAVPGEHVWIVVSTHVLSTEAMRAADRGEQITLDAETFASLSRGCYVCEEPWSPRLSYRRCKGESR